MEPQSRRIWRKNGASVIVNYATSAQGAETVVAKIKAAGGKAKAVRADVSKPAEAKQLVDSAVAEFGKIDILVNNAAVYEFSSAGANHRKALRSNVRS